MSWNSSECADPKAFSRFETITVKEISDLLKKQANIS